MNHRASKILRCQITLICTYAAGVPRRVPTACPQVLWMCGIQMSLLIPSCRYELPLFSWSLITTPCSLRHIHHCRDRLILLKIPQSL